MTLLDKLKETQTGFTCLSDTTDVGANAEFEQAYLQVRDKEGRLLNDDQVYRLPVADPSNPHDKEWQCRQHSAGLVDEYLQQRQFSRSDWILDIGCGNGWFSHLVAKTTAATVLAIDINHTELEQASRVFRRDNLYFASLDLLRDSAQLEPCSLIFFNSCFQYFNQPKALLDLCLSLLDRGGEIHILDSPFYPPEQVAAAKTRSQDYYQQLETAQMNPFYHHHSDTLFAQYQLQWLYQPLPKSERSGAVSPFAWFKITR
ncbi:MAG: SAM-dependent methyltransferase [Phenylobacterium sp.]|jgi:SAM-dependent methyltransferase